MKNIKKLFVIVLFTSLSSTLLSESVVSHTLGGASGLIVTPTARLFEEESNLSLNFGYHFLFKPADAFGHLSHFSLSAAKIVEVGATFDVQDGEKNNDLFSHVKVKFFPLFESSKNLSMAVGGNHQILDIDSDDVQHATQLYFTATSKFGAKVPVEFTLMAGKTFVYKKIDGDIDVSMGLDIAPFQKLDKGITHFMFDFSNHGYSQNASFMSTNRGVFNAGVRFDVLRMISRFNLEIDVLGLDLLDSNRFFGMMATLAWHL